MLENRLAVSKHINGLLLVSQGRMHIARSVMAGDQIDSLRGFYDANGHALKQVTEVSPTTLFDIHVVQTMGLHDLEAISPITYRIHLETDTEPTDFDGMGDYTSTLRGRIHEMKETLYGHIPLFTTPMI